MCNVLFAASSALTYIPERDRRAILRANTLEQMYSQKRCRPPSTRIHSPVMKSLSTRKSIVLAISAAPAHRRSGVASITSMFSFP